MPNRFLWRVLVLLLMLVPLAVAAGTAGAASKKAPKNVTLQMKGKLVVKKNKFLKDGAGFVPGNVVIRSGGKLTLRNRQEAPHTFTIVTKKDLPDTTNEILDCGSPGNDLRHAVHGAQAGRGGQPDGPDRGRRRARGSTSPATRSS